MVSAYLFPHSVSECLEMLNTYEGARIIAGGTDLIIDIKKKRLQPRVLVDITRIPELNLIQEKEDTISLGAGVTHREAATSPLIREKLPALAQAASSVGSPQIRNVGTLAGNVVNAQPAADTAVALVALGAEAEIWGSQGKRRVAVEDLYEGVGRSKVDSTRELLGRFLVPKWGEGEASAFVRLSPRRALSLPILNVAVRVQIKDGRWERARICVAPVAPQPFLCQEAAEALIGAKVSQEKIQEAAKIAAELAQPRDSLLRGSRAYRKEMVRVLVRRALETAIQAL
ncbi:carbon-monoxide dehydrogenase medium subunit [Thermanaeromonas toyohensis ToBE]|uniref:Carbon-monoxide dehydrogenase medium subunit n=1 Tax=Thermanaeromonas toyohensis ToBE TaxID=698762 RepID=A0A1W1W327_9FIRM|nr:FAD binding domain-containing protein [Thermanaeromonas toyohensis]SMB99504.1 carbon-monoxide dehydrogenase medium subunit [Thermanaeromonas toyohensis ToBE]